MTTLTLTKSFKSGIKSAGRETVKAAKILTIAGCFIGAFVIGLPVLSTMDIAAVLLIEAGFVLLMKYIR